jgi:FAD/FMN-containing dehydrogenase
MPWPLTVFYLTCTQNFISCLQHTLPTRKTSFWCCMGKWNLLFVAQHKTYKTRCALDKQFRCFPWRLSVWLWRASQKIVIFDNCTWYLYCVSIEHLCNYLRHFEDQFNLHDLQKIQLVSDRTHRTLLLEEPTLQCYLGTQSVPTVTFIRNPSTHTHTHTLLDKIRRFWTYQHAVHIVTSGLSDVK